MAHGHVWPIWHGPAAMAHGPWSGSISKHVVLPSKVPRATLKASFMHVEVARAAEVMSRSESSRNLPAEWMTDVGDHADTH